MSHAFREYRADFGRTRGLGIAVKSDRLYCSGDDAVIVTGLEPGAELPKSLGIEVGDFLVAVNGVRCVGRLHGKPTTTKMVAMLVKTARAPRVLTFRRYASALPPSTRKVTARQAKDVAYGVKTGVFSAMKDTASRPRAARRSEEAAEEDEDVAPATPTRGAPPRSARRLAVPPSAVLAPALRSASPMREEAAATPSLKPSLVVLMALAAFLRLLPLLSAEEGPAAAIVGGAPHRGQVALAVAAAACAFLFLGDSLRGRAAEGWAALPFRIAASLWCASAVWTGEYQCAGEAAAAMLCAILIG
jgi:hypothetical protein